jgi:hypothetical protein
MESCEDVLRRKIPNMFGEIDCIFAGHPCDEERAIKLLNYAFYNHIPIKRFLKLCEKYLKNTGCCKSHILQQVNNISKATFSPYNKIKSKRCWLISKEIDFDAKNLQGNKIITSQSVINIVDSRKSADSITAFINFYISSNHFNLQQKLAYQQRKNNITKPLFAYPYKIKGSNFNGLIIYENISTYIVARLIDNLTFKKVKNDDFIQFEDKTYSIIQRVEEYLKHEH